MDGASRGRRKAWIGQVVDGVRYIVITTGLEGRLGHRRVEGRVETVAGPRYILIAIQNHIGGTPHCGR